MLIYGNGELADVFQQYQLFSSEFTVEKKYWKTSGFLGKRVIAFNEKNLKGRRVAFPISYINMNGTRKRIMEQAISWGATPIIFIDRSSSIRCQHSKIGVGSIILDQCSINPKVDIGRGVIIWSNAHIGHSSILQDYCWITTGAVLCGGVTLGEQSFVGANAVISPNVRIGKRCLIAAGAIITKDTEDDSVYLEGRNTLISKKSYEINL